MVSLGSSMETDPSVLPMFSARFRDSTDLLPSFHAEQDSILDQLILLQRGDEFKRIHAPIETSLMKSFYLIKSFGVNLDVTRTDSDRSTFVQNTIQLPKIQLPFFDGDLLKWCSYRDTFTSLVHENIQLSNSQKFHYLISTLSGAASSIIRVIPLSDAN